MHRRTPTLRREALADLTEHDLRAAVGAEAWSANAMTCPANTCQSLASLFHTMCICPTEAEA